jgi:hypothetical protein
MTEEKTGPSFDEWQVTSECVWKGCAKDTNQDIQVLCYAHLIYLQNVRAISLKQAFATRKRGKRCHHFPLHFLAIYTSSCLVQGEAIRHTTQGLIRQKMHIPVI